MLIEEQARALHEPVVEPADEPVHEPPADPRTRERVLAAVTLDGPVTASQLGNRLGLTPAAVRRHLDSLAAAGAIREFEPVGPASRGRGRPARRWVVSPAGHDALASGYGVLAAQALRYLAAYVGPEAVAGFAQDRIAAQEQRYAGALAEAGAQPRARVDALVAALNEDGFAATARPIGSGHDGGEATGIQLCQGHCPVRHVAEEFPQLCQAETDAFSRLIGVHVQRLSTIAGGQHVCTTFVPIHAIPVHATTVHEPTEKEATR
ncbi:MAG: helix-turn-helix transcriptional regulator [Nocardioides sp.]